MPESLDDLRQEVAQDKARLRPLDPKAKRFEWRYKSYRQLHSDLGHGDGMAECIEVALRDFLDAARRSGDPKSFLMQRAQAQGIVVYQLDFPNIPNRAANLYITGAYQQLEAFIREFLGEASEVLGIALPAKQEGDALVDSALKALPGGLNRNKKRIWVERYELLEYFRQVRNGFVHTGKERKAIDRAFEKAFRWRPLIEADYGLRAPNRAHRLTLDDFLLFTRLIKYFATDVCRMAVPSRQQVFEHAARRFNSGDLKFSGLPLSAKNQSKPLRQLQKIYQGRFGYNLSQHAGLAEQILGELSVLAQKRL